MNGLMMPWSKAMIHGLNGIGTMIRSHPFSSLRHQKVLCMKNVVRLAAAGIIVSLMFAPGAVGAVT